MKKYKIYVKGNYLVVVDTQKNEYFYGIRKEVHVDKSNVNTPSYRIFNVKDFNDTTVLSVPNILKEDGTPYSELEFDTFYQENTGNFNSPQVGGDFLSKDISTYTPATTPLSGTEKALIHDGTDFKEVAVSEFIYKTDGKSYESLSVAMAVVPLPENNTIFYIDESNLTERGMYAYDSSEVSGYRFVRDYTHNGAVEEGNTQAVSGGKVYDEFYKVKTYNLLDPKYIERGKYLSSNGTLLNGANFNVVHKIPVLPNQEYCFYNLGSNRNLLTYDSDGVFIQLINNALDLAFPIIYKIPANVYYISFYLTNNTGGMPADLSRVLFTKGREIYPYIPHLINKDLDFFVDKRTYNTSESAKKTIFLNENKNFAIISNRNTDYLLDTANHVVVNANDAYLESCGIKEVAKMSPFPSLQVISGVRFDYDTPKNIGLKHVYASCFLKTTNFDLIPSLSNSGIYGIDTSGTIRLSTLISNSVTKIKDGLFRLDSVVKLADYSYNTLRIRILLTPNQPTNAYDYYMSNVAYCVTDKFHDVKTLLPVLFGENKILASQMDENMFVYKDIEKSMRKKKWTLYGTSIEAGGYFDDVAKAYNADYINFGNGGGGILWTDNPTIGNNIWNAPLNVSPQKAWSATWAEKELYLTTNGIPILPTSRTDCFDQNLLTNLDSDLFMIGTYGINDRKSGESSAFVIDKINRRFDRTTIYGAYNYILKKLFEAKPNARVVIFGQHCFGWEGTDKVNEIQREVAKDWCIPFLDWGYKMGMSNMSITVNGVEKTVLTATYASDGAHPNAAGKSVMADFLIRALRDIV